LFSIGAIFLPSSIVRKIIVSLSQSLFVHRNRYIDLHHETFSASVPSSNHYYVRAPKKQIIIIIIYYKIVHVVQNNEKKNTQVIIYTNII